MIRNALRAWSVAALLLAVCAGCSRPGPTADPDAPARRIVSLAPPFTETLFALGRGDRVVGRSRFCDVPPEASRLPAVGDATSLDVEAILTLRPDVVLTMSRAHVDELAPLGDRLRVRYVPHDTVEDALASIEILGRIAETPDAAAALVARIRTSIATARARWEGKPRPRVLIVIDRDPFYVAGFHSFLGRLLEIAGGRNVIDDVERPYPVISAETIVVRAPDVIVDATHGGSAEEARAFWSRFPSIPAVREGRVRVLAGTAPLRPGPRMPEAIATLERLVHGEESGEDR